MNDNTNIINNGYQNKTFYDPRISSIAGKYKKFDQQLHDKYDIPARNKLKDVLGDIVLDNENIYEQDLKIDLDLCKYKYLEVQVCAEWIEEFPRKKPYVFVRKARYGLDTIFITMSRDLERCILFTRNSFKNEKPVRYKKYSKFYIYEIPDNQYLKMKVNDIDTYLLINM